MPTYTAGKPQSAKVYFVKPDIYEVEIVKATEKISSRGNEMIKLEVKVLLKEGDGPIIWEYLTFVPAAAPIIDCFLASIGKATVEGEDVEIHAEDLIGEKAVAYIGEDYNSDSEYKNNKVVRWLHGDEKIEWLKKKDEPF